MSFKFLASNRHWVFAKQNVLGPLNDQLAQRHGAEYTFEVPESSFDWDVEFSVIKDRSGNTLREQYMATWVQPSLVAPGEKIYQLGARVNWRNPDVFGKKSQFDQNEIASLMAKVDEILGSPIKVDKKEVKEELAQKPTSITNQKKETLTLSSVNRVIRIATELVGETSEAKEMANTVFNAIKIVNDAKKLNSINTQQLEIQDAYDQLNELKSSPSTALIGLIGVMICDRIRQGTVKDEDIYDILSRIARQISDSKNLIGKAADFKLKAINDIENIMMNLFNDTTIDKQVETIYSDLEQEQLMIYLDKSMNQVSELRDMSLNFDMSDTPAPQVVEKYVEEIKENPTS